MVKNRFLMSVILGLCLSIPSRSLAQTVTDYLVLEDIGSYRISTPKELIPGVAPIGGPRTYDGAGVLSSTGHFDDHKDTSYKVMYLGGDVLPSPTVIVVQHAGADSDKWLLHELEDGYRDDEALNAAADTNVQMRAIDGNNVYFIGIYGGKSYSWISNNIVVDVSCSSCPNTKPEPLEIVKAYLAKHPSTITLTDTDMKSNAHNETWIKDEMERRLWLCDKWFMQLQLGKAGQSEVLKESVEHMEEFLEYREKYYGVSGEEEKDLLDTYLGQKSGTEIRNRLEALKQWWDDNRENPINL